MTTIEELKRNVNAVKLELDEELKALKNVTDKIDKNKEAINGVREEQRDVFLAHKKELTTMEECVKQCQIQIGQHHERLNAFETHTRQQNGTLDKLADKIDDVGQEIHNIITKVDAMDMSIANRINKVERNNISREGVRDKEDASREAELREREGVRDLATRADIERLRADWMSSRITFNWKIIGAVSSITFLFLLVLVSYAFHVFAFWP